MPVATVRMFGSKTMSSGGKPISSVRMRYARSAIATLRSTVVACPSSSNAMTIDGGAVAADEARVAPERLLALLQADRVHDGLALQALQPRLDHVPLRAVEHDRQLRDVRLGREEVQEARHRGFAVQHPLVHVHVEDVRAALDLLARHGERALVVAREDELRELRRPGDVRPLADERERLPRGGACTARGRERRVRRSAAGIRRGGSPCTASAIARMCAGVVPQQPPTMFTQPSRAKPPMSRAHDLGRLVEAAERVREPRVRIRAQEDGRDPGQLLDVRAHLLRAERAVDPDREERRVRDRVPERLDHLARERPPGLVRDRDGGHQRDAAPRLVEVPERGEERGLEDERVEDGLEEQEVDAAVDEAADLLRVGRDELVEDVGSLSRVVHVHRERERPVRGADRARHEGVLSRGARGARPRPCARRARPRRSSRTRGSRGRSRRARSPAR